MPWYKCPRRSDIGGYYDGLMLKDLVPAMNATLVCIHATCTKKNLTAVAEVDRSIFAEILARLTSDEDGA